MLIKIDLEPSIIRKIEQLINCGAYSDIRQFVNVAVSNQLEEEASASGIEMGSSRLTAELSSHQKAMVGSPNREQTTIKPLIPTTFNWRRQLPHVQLEQSQIQPKSTDLIWYFYNRFFPLKVVIYQLAKTIVSQQNNWAELGDLQVQAFEFAQEVATRLKNMEMGAKMPRNKKLSTGLPASNVELFGLRGTAKKKKDDKILRGRTRFMDQIVGKYVTRDRTFSGACFELGLIGVKPENQTCYVSLTELGREFASLENPILDKESYESAFSDKEVHLIFHKVYSRFPLENRIIKKIIEGLKKENLTSSQIDGLFKDEKREFLIQERIATMGRLSELQIVNWEIDSEGKSKYSLNEKKLQLLE